MYACMQEAKLDFQKYAKFSAENWRKLLTNIAIITLTPGFIPRHKKFSRSSVIRSFVYKTIRALANLNASKSTVAFVKTTYKPK
jgi:hypothetical protein